MYRTSPSGVVTLRVVGKLRFLSLFQNLGDGGGGRGDNVGTQRTTMSQTSSFD